MEDKESRVEIPEKIDNVLKNLHREQGQSTSDEKSKEIKSKYSGENTPSDEERLKTNMEIAHNIQYLTGFAQLWESRPQLGNKEEADQLMKLGLLKMKKELYTDLSPESLDSGIDFSIQDFGNNAKVRKADYEKQINELYQELGDDEDKEKNPKVQSLRKKIETSSNITKSSIAFIADNRKVLHE